jgi:hypothetical protein
MYASNITARSIYSLKPTSLKNHRWHNEFFRPSIEKIIDLHPQMRRLTSIWLIFMILVTSSGYWAAASQRSLLISKATTGTSCTILISHADAVPEAFREEIKVSVSEESKSGTDVGVHKASAYLVERAAIKCRVHLRANLGSLKPQRLFIALGALLI